MRRRPRPHSHAIRSLRNHFDRVPYAQRDLYALNTKAMIFHHPQSLSQNLQYIISDHLLNLVFVCVNMTSLRSLINEIVN